MMLYMLAQRAQCCIAQIFEKIANAEDRMECDSVVNLLINIVDLATSNFSTGIAHKTVL